jgi:hypothetical protein
MLGSASADGVQEINLVAISAAQRQNDWDRYSYDFLIVPGYTPIHTRRPLTVADIPVG